MPWARESSACFQKASRSRILVLGLRIEYLENRVLEVADDMAVSEIESHPLEFAVATREVLQVRVCRPPLPQTVRLARRGSNVSSAP